MTSKDAQTVRVDIVSDVVCPWCVVGYRQLAAAAAATGVGIDVHWHPFELNRHMAPEGEDLREHLAGKYGTTPEQSAAARARLTAVGAELGFEFAFAEDSRIFNTFRAHQAITWAEGQGRGHDMKQALFDAYFTQRRDVSSIDVLEEVAVSLGLDGEAARATLESEVLAPPVRAEEDLWVSRGITGVPAMVFQEKYLVVGAQGVEAYSQVLREVRAEATA